MPNKATHALASTSTVLPGSTLVSPLIPTSSELAALEKRALRLAESADLLAAFNDAARSAKAWERAVADTSAFLEKRGVKSPRGLRITFGRMPGPERPVPDYEFFTIRLTRCRSFWAKKRGGPGYEKVEVCLGFEIVPHPVPGGPIA